MIKKPKNSLVKRIIIFAVLAVALFYGLKAGFYVYNALKPDIPPFDESALAITRPNLPDSENGFLILEKAVGKTGDSSRQRFNDIKNIRNKRTVSEKKANRIYSKHGRELALFEEAAAKDFLVPRTSKTDEPVTNYLGIKHLADAELILAWRDLRNNQTESAVNRILIASTTGSKLQSAHGDFLPFMIGSAIARNSMEEINAMVDSKAIPAKYFAQIINTMNPDITQANAKDAVKEDYFSLKQLKRASMKEYANKQPIPILRKLSKDYYKPNIDDQHTYVGFKHMNDDLGKPYSSAVDYMLETIESNKKIETFKWKMKCYTRGWHCIAEILQGVALPNYYRILQKTFLTIAEQNALRIKLAALSYEAEHGKLPDTLGQLVPAYLEKMPIDPFDRKPMRYDPKKGIVYSVGFNSKDDGGRADEFMFETKENIDFFIKNKKPTDLVLRIHIAEQN